MYGPFISEEVVGEALQGIRNKVVLETKFGFDIDPQTRQRRGGFNSRPDNIKQTVEAQLRRLEPIGSTCSTSIGSIRKYLSRTWPAQ